MWHSTEGERRRGRRAIAFALIVASSTVAAPAEASGVISVVPADVEDASEPSISSDGRWIVFGGLDGERRTVYRTDRETGTTSEISPLPKNAQPGDTIHARLSSDGCVVVAITEVAFDLFRDDDRRERWDVYRLVLPECGGQANGWELVSMNRNSSIDDVFPDSAPTLSGSGAIIAYTHQLDDAPEGVGTIRVVDITVPPNEPGREQNVAGMPAEAPNRAFSYRGAREPALSDDGRHLAFVADTTASAALPGWASGREPGGEATAQVFVWDRFADAQGRPVILASGRDGVPSAFGARSPAISDDGRVVAFVSADRTLLPAELPACRSECPTQIYRFDRDTDGNGVFDEPPRVAPLSLISAVGGGRIPFGLPVAGDASSWAPALNADGSEIAFVSDATNLLPSRRGGGGEPDDGDLLVAQFELGTIRRVLDGADATGVPGAHANPVLSRTGQVIVFETVATSLLGDGRGEPGRRSIATVEVTPRLSLAELDFGSVIRNFRSAELYVQVQNAGPAAFEPAVVTATSNFEVTGGSCVKGIMVAAGSSCSVHVTFLPTEVRGYTGSLTVAGLEPDGASVTTTLRGSAGDPVLLAIPGGVDVAPGIVGDVGGRVAIDIQNISFLPTEVTRIQIGGAHPADFKVVTQSCTRRALNPEVSCTVEVEFRPTDPGYRSALLIATVEGGAYTAAVVGGYARYAPSFATSEPTVTAGTEFGIGLRGYPENSRVTIGFDDGSAPFASVLTDENGALLAYVQMPSRVRAGGHRLVASAGETAIATTSIEVVARRARSIPLPGYGMG